MSRRDPLSSIPWGNWAFADPTDLEDGKGRPGFWERSVDMLARATRLSKRSCVHVLLTPSVPHGDLDAEALSRTIRELDERIADYETLLRVIPIGISITTDPECKVIVSNERHAALLGHDAAQNTSIDPRAMGPGSFRIFQDGMEIGVDEL